MYLSNKYTVWYFNIINRAQEREIFGYHEKHHIIPKSLGGDNSKSNLVKLTAREHLICHLLLTKMTEGKSNHKMVTAAFLMSNKGRINSRLYETLKINFIRVNSQKQRGSANHFYGKTHSKESIDKMKASIQSSLTDERRAEIKYARTMWRHNQANKQLWLIADELYHSWLSSEDTFNFITIEKQFGLKRYSTQNIISHFVKGWNPLKDNEYLLWKQTYR